MNRRKLASLYTLQHCLARDAEEPHGVDHRDMAVRRGLDKARPDLIADADSPRGPRGDLLPGDEAVGEPAVESGGNHAEDLRRLRHGHELALPIVRFWLEPGYLPVPPKIAHLALGEPVACGRPSSLPVENACDDGIFFFNQKTAYEIDGL